VSLSNAVISLPYEIEDVTDGNESEVRLRAYASVEQFPTAEGLLTVRFPFSGDRWQRTYRIYDPNLAFNVARFAADGPTTRLVLSTNDPGNQVNSPNFDPNDKNSGQNSNVVKLYTALQIDNDQVGYYHPGVGTMGAPTATHWWSRKWSPRT